MIDFEFDTTKSLCISRGGAAAVAQRVAALGCRNALLISDRNLVTAGVLDAALSNFSRLRLRVDVFSEVEADPPEDVILKAVAAVNDCGADCVVGFGGGSSMDTAKLAALLAGSGERLDEVYGVKQAKGPRLPLILVPTTAGTGSEVTPIAIVTTGSGEKKGVVSPCLLPDIALLDAELTVTVPPHVTAATGIDAMVHAIEAYTSRGSKNPVSDCLAREALRLLSGAIHRACSEGADLAAREQMLLGACLAGIAFANAPVAAVHALAYPIGARFHVPHGLSNSLILAPVVRFNLDAAVAQYAQICEVVRPLAQGDERGKAESLIEWLAGLPGELGLPTRLRDVGIPVEAIPQLARDAMQQTRLLVNNPREVTLGDALALYREAW